MRVLLIGAGGVGEAVARLLATREFCTDLVVADYDEGRARRAVDRSGAARASAVRIDAADAAAVAELATSTRADAVLNAVDPRFVMPIFSGALAARATYLDMAMSLSRPHPQRPYEEPGV